MTIPELQTAFLNRLPVIYHYPNNEPIEYAYISEIIYSQNPKTKSIMVSCKLIDKRNSNSCTVARSRYIYPKEKIISIESTNFQIPSKIKNAFIKQLPVTISLPDKTKMDFQNISSLVLKINEDKIIETFCVFESKYTFLEVQSKHVKQKSKSTERINYKAIVDLFIELCPELPKPLRLNDTRKKAIKSGIEDGIDFAVVFSKVHQSDYLSGRSGKWKNCNFDWCIKSSNRIKILEGNFDNRETETNRKASYNIDDLEEIR